MVLQTNLPWLAFSFRKHASAKGKPGRCSPPLPSRPSGSICSFQGPQSYRAVFCRWEHPGPGQKGSCNFKPKGKYKISICTRLTENAPCLDFRAFGRLKLHRRLFFLIRKAQRARVGPALTGVFCLLFDLRHRSNIHTRSIHPFYNNSWFCRRTTVILQATAPLGHLLHLWEDISWRSRHCGRTGISTACLRHHLLSSPCQPS